VRSLGLVTLVVRDYDEAIAFYAGVLGFEPVEDTPLGGGKRWVVLRPGGGADLLLARAATPAQEARVGDQTGGRVGLFLFTDDFAGDHRRMREAGVVFEEAPRAEPYGTVAVFRDLYGNRWDLIESTRLRERPSPASGPPGPGGSRPSR
jgi:catechol 2,3-dioxygenase-like lactoylglutathione lyase family enzyme